MKFRQLSPLLLRPGDDAAARTQRCTAAGCHQVCCGMDQPAASVGRAVCRQRCRGRDGVGKMRRGVEWGWEGGRW